ncbi:MAG: hypothetical protein K8I82_23245, partial [Anaerolineae bacterium]|nr:hypothetical protein [Anaerolineae bacterium]
MGVLTKASSRPSKKASAAFRVRTLPDVLALVAMGAAFLLLIAYLVIAINWLRQPFLGAMFTRSLTVADVQPFSNRAWPALDASVSPGDTLLGINAQEWDSENRANGLKNTLDSLEQGQQITLNLLHEGKASSNLQCEPPVEGQSFCTTTITLSRIPALDFLLHFGVGYLVGVVVFLIGVGLLWQRFELLSAKAAAVSLAALAVLVAGRFDLMTTFALIPGWI